MGGLESKLVWNSNKDALDSSGPNDRLLDFLYSILNDSCNDNVSLAHEVCFSKPLEFYTRLIPNDYKTIEDSKEYVVNDSGTECKAVSVVSNRPSLLINRFGDSSFQVSIFNFWALRSHLRAAGRYSVESRRREMATLLECERYLVQTLSGSKESITVSLSSTPQGDVEQAYDDETNGGRVSALSDRALKTERLLFFRMLRQMEAKLDSFQDENDEEYSPLGVQLASGNGLESSLTVKEVTSEINSLQNLCGSNEARRGLRFLHWESEYEYTGSGSYAPPWRAPKGEIGYVLAGTFDKGVLVLTCTFNGYFVNKGYYVDANGKERLNYDAISRVYSSLSDLLEDNSSHFADALRLAEAGEIFSESDSESEHPTSEMSSVGDAKEQRLSPAPSDSASSVRSSALSRQSPSRMPVQHIDQEDGRKKQHSKTGSRPGSSMATRRRESETPRTAALRKLISSGSLKDVRSAGAKSSRPVSSSSVRRHQRHDMAKQEDESDDEKAEEEEEEEENYINPDICPNYNNIHRIVTRSLAASESSTLIYGLCQLEEMDLQDGVNQLALLDVGGLKPLLRLIEVNDTKVVVGAAQVLRTISSHPRVQNAIAKLNGVRPVVSMLGASQDIVRVLGAQVLMNLAKHTKACIKIQKTSGIEGLMNCLKEATECLAGDSTQDPTKKELMSQLALSAAIALRSAAKADTSKTLIRENNGVEALSSLLTISPPDLLVPLAGIVLECTEDAAFREELQVSDCMRTLVGYLNAPSSELRALCGEAICRCAVDGGSGGSGGKAIQTKDVLAPLVTLLSSTDKPLLISATAAIQKSLSSESNVSVFLGLSGPASLIAALSNSPYEEVQVNITGAIWNVAKVAAGRAALRSGSSTSSLVELLRKTSVPLLINVTGAIGACAMDDTLKVAIAEADGLRLLWSLLRLNHAKVQANAAGAICPLLDHPKNLAIVGEQLTGGLQLLVDLLRSDDENVQSNVCAAIANVAKAEYALAVLSEQGVLPELASLCSTCTVKVRKNLACAISQCCSYGDNRAVFGELGGVAPLVDFLDTSSADTLRASVLAMLQLSEDPQNAVTLRKRGVVTKLVGLLAADDRSLQDMAAATLSNVRAITLH
eukprot:CAMPEP_0113886740 /NCGR_PEP_ID=MMETSP0780_2-20120614/11744_1 /TAXON_ID=652834 /ORGANISM="Palpitomonas bilix" /LENGTH=1111 /DNA_ID=CAMNT_0000875031 /DNA_START=130 /DNA_END=3465 /DNA_ORIENTATION=- /assembly_acc=CAM_ASM_000599